MASELGDNITPESQEQQNIANQRNDAANTMHHEVLTSGNDLARAQDNTGSFPLEQVSSTELAQGERCSDVNNYVRFASAVSGMPAEGLGSKADIRKVFDDFAVLNPDRAAFFRSAESKVFT